MQIIIPLLQGITGLHGGGCQWAKGWLDSPLCPPSPPDLSEPQFIPRPLVWQEWPGACDAPLSCISGTHRPNLIAALQWQGGALLEATQGGQVITAAPSKESSSPRSTQSHLAQGASRARWAFFLTLYTPTGGKRPGQGQTSSPQNPSPPTFNKCVFTASDTLITVFKNNPLCSGRPTVLSFYSVGSSLPWWYNPWIALLYIPHLYLIIYFKEHDSKCRIIFNSLDLPPTLPQPPPSAFVSFSF